MTLPLAEQRRRLLLARMTLLIGNFVTGVAIMGLAGMLEDLARGLDVTIRDAGLLVTFGAVVLCIGSPIMVGVTSRVDRRMLLGGSVAIVALLHLASAMATGYGTLLALRLVMMAFAALYTPLAASTIALIVPEPERPSAIAFVFLGFSLAMAAGLPLVTFLSAHVGWQATFGAIGIAGLLCAALHFAGLPRGLRVASLPLSKWLGLGRNRLIVLLLGLTIVQVSGQFILFTYLAPLMTRLVGAGTVAIGFAFSLFGIAGFVGNVIAARLVTTFNPARTSLAALCSILLGFSIWSFGAGMFAVMLTGVLFWGLGFAAINSMQQARLAAAAPDLASASIALNTSGIYIGQAIGSAIGGLLFMHDLPRALGYSAMVFAIAAIMMLGLTQKADREDRT